ncbi:flippase [Spirosoma spitsbergense]|uniref:flippase n=1 Tax=Spirosoma spitsbergense TaxID=431554 RepID=UPI00037A1191|nr:flippase [Spirosoma spitsbergense]
MRKIIANIGWIFFDKIFRMAIGIIVSLWIARYLGPSEFGILNYAILFPTIFVSVAGFGLTNTLMVEFVATVDNPLQQQKLVQLGLFIKLIAGSLMYGVSCCLNYALNRDNPELFYLINVTGFALVLQSSDIIDTYFQSQTKAKLSVVVKLIAFVVASLFRIYALLNHKGILSLALINLVELTIIYGLMVIVYQRYSSKIIENLRQAINWQSIVQLVKISWPIMITEFFVFVYMKVDQFMIESLSTNHELGLYGAALRLSEAWYFIAIAINTSFYPKIAESWIINREKFYIQYQELLNVLTYVSVGLAIFVSCFSSQLIKLLFGKEFIDAGPILSVHIWAGVFVFTGVGTNNLMIIKNLQRFVLIKTIIGAFINVALNFWLIPKIGALGASIATLVSYGIQAYAMNIFFEPARSIFNLQSRSFLNFITFQRPMTVKIS